MNKKENSKVCNNKKSTKKPEHIHNSQGNFFFDETELVKQTLMAAAFPALVTSYKSDDGETFYKGFLPNFKDADICDLASEDECIDYLQDLLDDKVEELIITEKELPDVEEDELLLKHNPGYKIVYLDINVYALPEECHHHCHECDCGCENDYECDDECNCHDDCGCGSENCHCGDDCSCTPQDNCGCNCCDN